MHDFSLFGFVVREGMAWLQSCFFFRARWMSISVRFLLFFFEGKIKLANELQSFSGQWPLYACCLNQHMQYYPQT